jgi:hypothetical protein
MFNIFENRGIAGGVIQMGIDGAPIVGFVKSVSGGYVKGNVAAEQAGPNYQQFKHVATVDIEPLKVELGMSLAGPFLLWIAETWRKGYSRRNGYVAHGDYSQTARVEQVFMNALLSEVGFPTLDATSKDSLYLNCTIVPEQLELIPGMGPMIGLVPGAQKMYQASRFIVNIDGIDCTGINKIDGFTVKQKVKKFSYGSFRYPEIEPTGIEFPTLTFYTGLDHAATFYAWHKMYVIDGRRDITMEKNGQIIYMGPGFRPLMVLLLKNVGIQGVSIEKSDAGADKIKLVKVELFCEEIDIVPGGGFGI